MEKPLDKPPFGMPAGLWEMWLAADKASRSLSPELQGAALQVRAYIRTFTKISFLDRTLGELIAMLTSPRNRETLLTEPANALPRLFAHVDELRLKLKKMEDETV